MATVELKTSFEPELLRAFMKNEFRMKVEFRNSDPEQMYWCESDIIVKAPLSLAHDMPMENGRMRIGLLKPNSTISKVVNLYTLPNNFPDSYKINFVVYLYDEDGTISDRIEKTTSIECRQNKTGASTEMPKAAGIKP
ncbi:MAG: hypothetical protein QXR73_01335 [Candidatus Micrarchaeaceae archaeon]